MQTLTTIQAEFIKHKVFKATYYSLFVNGVKTNIYYPEKESTFLICSKEKAEAEAELIRTGQIYPHDGNYENFDICGTFYANLQDAAIVETRPEFFNCLYHVTGKDYTDKATQEEELKQIKTQIAYWSQWTKRIHKDTGKLLNNIGVKFYPYGYDVFYY